MELPQGDDIPIRFDTLDSTPITRLSALRRSLRGLRLRDAITPQLQIVYAARPFTLTLFGNWSTAMSHHIADNVSIETSLAEIPAPERIHMTTTLVYHVSSVEKADAPGGSQGLDWYCYVLKNNRSTINGFRRGTRQNVCDYAARYAEQLNERTVMCPSPWNLRGNKLAPRVPSNETLDRKCLSPARRAKTARD